MRRHHSHASPDPNATKHDPHAGSLVKPIGMGEDDWSTELHRGEDHGQQEKLGVVYGGSGEKDHHEHFVH